MAKKFRILLIFISLSLSLCIMSNTYSRYTAGATGDLEVQFAKWQILLNTNDITANASSNISIEPVLDENANVADKRIAPTSTGHFDIVVDPTHVDVSYDYSIGLVKTDETLTDLLITKYAIIDEAHPDDENLVATDIGDDGIISGSYDYVNGTPFKQYTIRIYFEWLEGGEEETMDNAADTAVGENAAKNNTSFQITSNISFKQKLTQTVAATEAE